MTTVTKSIFDHNDLKPFISTSTFDAFVSIFSRYTVDQKILQSDLLRDISKSDVGFEQ